VPSSCSALVRWRGSDVRRQPGQGTDARGMLKRVFRAANFDMGFSRSELCDLRCWDLEFPMGEDVEMGQEELWVWLCREYMRTPRAVCPVLGWLFQVTSIWVESDGESRWPFEEAPAALSRTAAARRANCRPAASRSSRTSY